MGFDPQISYTEVDKDGDVEDRIWGQVMRLNPPMEEKTMEEIRSRNSETAQDKSFESDGFLRSLSGRNIS